jgi:hypothetical protein
MHSLDLDETPSSNNCTRRPLEDIHFKKLYELMKTTSPTAHMWEMNIALRGVQVQQRFGVSPDTVRDIVEVLHRWRHNPKGVPLPIHGESDGALNI